MYAIAKAFVFAITATALVFPRSITQLSHDITAIDTKTNKLTSSITAYRGGSGVLGALPLQASEQDLTHAMQAATHDARATLPATSAESARLLAQVKTLIPDIEGALDALTEKKGAFEEDGLVGTVRGDVVGLREDARAFGEAAVGIASQDTRAEGARLVARIDADFAAAMEAFE